MTLYTTRMVLVIPAEQRAAANAACATLGFGPNNFCAPVWTEAAMEAAAATHYWCSWAMKPESEAVVLGALADAGVVVEVRKLDRSDPKVAKPSPDEVLLAEGLKDWRGVAETRDKALGAGQVNARPGGGVVTGPVEGGT